MLKSVSTGLASEVCIRLSNLPEASNAAVRLAVWMLGVAEVSGGFPLTLSLRQICRGFRKDGKEFKGTGSRIETVKASIQWLEEEGFLAIGDGTYSGFGFTSKNYTIKV